MRGDTTQHSPLWEACVCIERPGKFQGPSLAGIFPICTRVSDLRIEYIEQEFPILVAPNVSQLPKATQTQERQIGDFGSAAVRECGWPAWVT